MQIIVLGAGMVGSAMAIDLAKNHSVTLADVNHNTLEKIQKKSGAITIVELDVTNQALLQQTIAPFDLVVCAVPGFLGYQTLSSIIEAAKDVVDISFFPENALELDALAKSKGVTAVVDCGVAPGMGNIILGHYNEQMTITRFECLVGGLPQKKTWPFAYKAPFSPIDVIEEYTRPARYVEHGKLVTRPPLTDCEFIEFDNVGTLEAFNSDGLRSLIYTMPHIPNMKEKTLRYPGHAEYIKVLKAAGFFDHQPIEVNGQPVSPLDFTSQLLFKSWYLAEDEAELTVMRITIEGEKKTVQYHLYDEFNETTQTSSMARTTGYTATAVANLVLDGMFKEKGIFPPELVGKHNDCFQYILEYLSDRQVMYIKTLDQLIV